MNRIQVLAQYYSTAFSHSKVQFVVHLLYNLSTPKDLLLVKYKLTFNSAFRLRTFDVEMRTLND